MKFSGLKGPDNVGGLSVDICQNNGLSLPAVRVYFNVRSVYHTGPWLSASSEGLDTDVITLKVRTRNWEWGVGGGR